MTNKQIIIDGKTIGCPCYIDRPLYRYDKACLIQSQAFTEQQTEHKPILRCDEIKNCPIKENYKQLVHKEKECNLLRQYKGSKQASYESMQIEWNKAVSRNKDLLGQIEKWQELVTELETENEKLKKKKEENTTFYLKKYANKDSECLDLQHKISILKQALTDIEEIVGLGLVDGLPPEEYSGFLKTLQAQILQKINSCSLESNEENN